MVSSMASFDLFNEPHSLRSSSIFSEAKRIVLQARAQLAALGGDADAAMAAPLIARNRLTENGEHTRRATPVREANWHRCDNSDRFLF